MECPFGLFMSVCWLHPLPASCAPPAFSLAGYEKLKSPQLSINTTQEQLKYQCASNIILVLNPDLSTVSAPRRKTNSIPAEVRTHIQTIYKVFHSFFIFCPLIITFPLPLLFPRVASLLSSSRSMSNDWTVGVLTLHHSSQYLCTDQNDPQLLKDQGTSFVPNEHMLWPRTKHWYTLSPRMATSPNPSDPFQLVVCLLLDDTLPCWL